jgi:hypothetical protein
MSLSDKQWTFLQDVALLIQWAERKGYKLTGGELHRLPETQEFLKNQGASNTNEGYHQKRLAIDLMLFIDGEYQRDTEAYKPLGEFWESLRPENRWGGEFSTIKDGNHFERTL